MKTVGDHIYMIHELAQTLQFPPNTGKNITLLRESLSAQFYAFEKACAGMKFPTVLDIGCGLASIDVLLVREFGAHTVYLIDGDGSAPQVHGWNNATKPWNDVEQGAWVIKNNAAAEVDVITYVVGKKRTHACDQVDLAISLRSWGHHYPVPVYLPLVRRALRPGGILILDIRRKTAGVQELEAAGFSMIGRIDDHSEKCDRLIFARQVAA
jgi:SAM-dependent methyltransferase